MDSFLHQGERPLLRELAMTTESPTSSELLYGLDDRPAPLPAFFAALQHVLACFVGIVTPTLIIGGVLGLHEQLPYLISMGLMVSGVGTLIQARRPFGIGAGMICVQGTSFAFLSAVLAAGLMVKARGGSPDEILAMIFGVCFFGAFIEMVLSRFIGRLQRVITPLDTCDRVKLDGARYQRVLASADPLTKAIFENYRAWAVHYKGVDPSSYSTILFDTVAVHLVFSTQFLTMERMGVKVTDAGMTIPDPAGPQLEVAIDWTDLSGFHDYLVERLLAPVCAAG